ncbi:MAG: hypothetical protein AB2A00_30045, partial [Myxococcota bacterium]
MSLIPILLASTLTFSAQAPAEAAPPQPPPSDVPAAVPPPAAPPSVEPAPAPAPEAAPPAAMPPADEALANPKHWRMTRVDVPVPSPTPGQPATRSEVRVLRADGTAVSVGEGLADVGWQKRLVDRAGSAEDPQAKTQDLIGRVAILGVGAGMVVVGLAVAGVGGVFWALTLQDQTVPIDQPLVQSMAREGLAIMVAGLVGTAIGLFTVVATAALWAWKMVQGPPPPDPATVQALGASLAWDEKEAADVVAKHNAAVDAAGAPPAEPAPAPAPAP